MNPTVETGTGPVALTAGEATRQSLARGTAGTALLHVERALAGSGRWGAARAHIREASAVRVDAGEHAGLYYGAPAIAFLLHCASQGDARYTAACEALDCHVLRLARRRLVTANARAKQGAPATFAEFDLFYGLTGIGALLLRRSPGSDVLAALLRYIVSLTRPYPDDGSRRLPGWWVAHDPDETLPTQGGHANFGMAHGASGLLALLALATDQGCVVEGQHEAIAVVTQWFDRWRQDGPDGPWWPQWVTREELHAGRPIHSGPGRPSWCYGTPGIARALQLAAIATGDQRRQEAAERALAASLTDSQLDRLPDLGLCHGLAGVHQVTYRAASDARWAGVGERLPELAARLAHRADPSRNQYDESGFLTGSVGAALALETARRGTPPRTGWDRCLLIA